MNRERKRRNRANAIAFIDASNLFYGGEKALGWSIDYKKLCYYLKNNYGCKQVYYFGGIDTFGYDHNYTADDTVSLPELLKYLRRRIRENTRANAKKRLSAKMERHIQRVKFYKKLQHFGYHLTLRPVKHYRDKKGNITDVKANCDLDMALHMIKSVGKYKRMVVLTGDGDFMSVLKYIKHNKTEVVILASSTRTAKEIRKFAGSNFKDFSTLRSLIEMKRKNERTSRRYALCIVPRIIHISPLRASDSSHFKNVIFSS